jgi:calcium-dependent protein kinase
MFGAETKINMNRLIAENKDAITKSYKIIERLGAGTFGKVYKVLHYPSGTHRAMKVVKKNSVNYQDDDKNFLKEIELLAKLDHPNILKIYEYYIDDSNYYVISELIQGGELYEQIVKMKTYSEKMAAVIMEQLLSAVCYLHSNNIVHRDLKPENVMLEMKVDDPKNKNKTYTKESEMFIKLIDFGAANYLKGELNLKIGTPYYIAPEVLKKKYNNKCDIWSCGVILYILLCAYPPFDGDTDDEIIKSVEKAKYTFDGEEWETVSKEAKDLITKMLKYDPDKRISSEDALKHVWFKNILKSTEIDEKKIKLLSNNIQNIQKFNSRHKLQQACIAFLVHQMSSNELTKDLRAIFKKMDVSGDGRLTYDELKEGYKKYFKESNISEADFEELIKSLDGDNNEYIEYEEFLRATVNADLLMTEKNMEMAFAHFDKDGSGKLSPDEIKFVLGVNETDKIKEAEILKNIISEVDENGDGEVSFEEFKTLMKKFLTNTNN